MTSLAEVYITLIGLDSALIEVIDKDLTDTSVLGLQLLAAQGKTHGSVIGEKLACYVCPCLYLVLRSELIS